MKKILLLSLLLLANGRTPTAPLNDVTQPTAAPPVTEASPTPVASATPSPTSLPPWSFPWATAGQSDSGYCSMRYGWGWTGHLRPPVEGYTAVRGFGHIPGGLHGGIDYTVPVGTAVVAPTTGVIVWSGGNSTGYGNAETGMVAIASGGRVVILAHLSGIVAGLDCGDVVTAGGMVGWSGGPGFGAASWPHVHMGVRWQGLEWDPMLWMG